MLRHEAIPLNELGIKNYELWIINNSKFKMQNAKFRMLSKNFWKKFLLSYNHFPAEGGSSFGGDFWLLSFEFFYGIISFCLGVMLHHNTLSWRNIFSYLILHYSFKEIASSRNFGGLAMTSVWILLIFNFAFSFCILIFAFSIFISIRIIRKFGRIRIIRITVFIRVIIRYIRANSRYSHCGFLFGLFANLDTFVYFGL